MSQDILEELKEANEAFQSAVAPEEINGIPLEPFNLLRQTAAVEIGYGTQTAFFDAILKVWLCSIKPYAVAVAMRNREQAVQEAFEWAEKQGLSFENSKPLLDLYKRINDEVVPAKVEAPKEEEP